MHHVVANGAIAESENTIAMKDATKLVVFNNKCGGDKEFNFKEKCSINNVCPEHAPCCSQYGHCGNDSDYCDFWVPEFC